LPITAYFKAATADPKKPAFEALVQSLIDLLEGGGTIDQFIKLYPPITREQVLTVLDFANRSSNHASLR
jgi:uncharacterized protein (DUF433 family)